MDRQRPEDRTAPECMLACGHRLRFVGQGLLPFCTDVKRLSGSSKVTEPGTEPQFHDTEAHVSSVSLSHHVRRAAEHLLPCVSTENVGVASAHCGPPALRAWTLAVTVSGKQRFQP